jgi:hypothetical protein
MPGQEKSKKTEIPHSAGSTGLAPVTGWILKQHEGWNGGG